MNAARLCAVVPVKEVTQAKQRLAGVLSASHREQLALAMFEDLLDALATELSDILVVTVDPAATLLAKRFGARVTADGARDGHTGAVSAAARQLVAEERAMLAISADIPLVQPADVRHLIAAHGDAPAFTIVPARDELGSNAILMSPPDAVPLRFGDNSYVPHLAAAQAQGIAPRVVRLPRIELDIDNPDDLAAFRRTPSQTRSRRLLDRWHAARIVAFAGQSK
jgi:2-phospho-L-lactate guanylyltransferase